MFRGNGDEIDRCIHLFLVLFESGITNEESEWNGLGKRTVGLFPRFPSLSHGQVLTEGMDEERGRR